jgi:hypothetical protein
VNGRLIILQLGILEDLADVIDRQLSADLRFERWVQPEKLRPLFYALIDDFQKTTRGGPAFQP